MCLALPSQKPDCEDSSARLHINICLPTKATMKSTFIISIVAMVGIAMTVTFGEQSSTVIHACSDSLGDTTVPCVQRYPERQEVCEDQMVSANITLHLPQVIQNNLMLSNVKVLIDDDEFSHGATLSGDFHNGDDGMDRWMSRILFEGNTMTYEIQNSKVQYRDEFECHMEIDIEGEKFESDPFQWFLVNNCAEGTTQAPSNKEESILSIIEQLNQVNFSLNTLGSNVVELQKNERMMSDLKYSVQEIAQTTRKSMEKSANTSDQLRAIREGQENVSKQHDTLNNKLDTQNIMNIAVLVLLTLLTVKGFMPTKLQKSLQIKLSGLLNHFRHEHTSSSSSSDDSSEYSPSPSGTDSRQDDTASNGEAAGLLQSNISESLLNLNPSDEQGKSQETVQPHPTLNNPDDSKQSGCTGAHLSTNDENQCCIEMSQINPS